MEVQLQDVTFPNGALAGYVDGNKPLIYLDIFNDTYCPPCANMVHDNPNRDVLLTGAFVNEDGEDYYCATCGKKL
jgi:hypothetical protein